MNSFNWQILTADVTSVLQEKMSHSVPVVTETLSPLRLFRDVTQ